MDDERDTEKTQKEKEEEFGKPGEFKDISTLGPRAAGKRRQPRNSRRPPVPRKSHRVEKRTKSEGALDSELERYMSKQ